MAAEEEWYFEEEGCLQFSGRPISVTFSPASNCFICTLEDGTIEVVDARSSLRLKRTSTAGLYDEMKHVILIWKWFVRLPVPFLRLLYEQVTKESSAQNADKSSFREFLIIKIYLIVLKAYLYMVPQDEIDLFQYVQSAVQILQCEPNFNDFALINVCKLRKSLNWC